MANTLTGLIPQIYQGLDIVSRELVGLVPAVSKNANAEQVTLNQAIRVPIVPTITTSNITPGVTAPNDGDQTISYVDVNITKSKYAPIRWNGEEQKGMQAGGQLNTVLANQFAQAFRVLANEVEADLAGLHVKASRAYGTAGTTPFGSDVSDSAQILKILQDNGAPTSDLQLVIDTSAGAKLRTLGQLTKGNEAGTMDTLRRGVLLDQHGFMIRESSQIKTFTKGTGASATTNAAGYAVGATVITLASAGTGTILAGDVITFAGDTNKYVVLSGDADVSNAGTITLASPGLRQAIGTSATAITLVATSARSMAFDRSAIQLVARVPAMPEGGDMADDVTVVVDPISGIAFQIALYRQYRQYKFEVGLAWGYELIKPEHVAILLG